MEVDDEKQELTGVPVFRPTMAEFTDFPKYIDYMESHGAHKIGLARIVPPKEWCARRNGYDDKLIENFKITSPIRQVAEGKGGVYTLLNMTHASMKVSKFRELASQQKAPKPRLDDKGQYNESEYEEELERKYWANLPLSPPLYGADVSGSLTDPDQRFWNCNHLGTILDEVTNEEGVRIEGVNTPYLYFGMWKSTFAWVCCPYISIKYR